MSIAVYPTPTESPPKEVIDFLNFVLDQFDFSRVESTILQDELKAVRKWLGRDMLNKLDLR